MYCSKEKKGLWGISLWGGEGYGLDEKEKKGWGFGCRVIEKLLILACLAKGTERGDNCYPQKKKKGGKKQGDSPTRGKGRNKVTVYPHLQTSIKKYSGHPRGMKRNACSRQERGKNPWLTWRREPPPEKEEIKWGWVHSRGTGISTEGGANNSLDKKEGYPAPELKVRGLPL